VCEGFGVGGAGRSFLGNDESGKSTKKPSPAEQHRRFIETARQLECDEDKERFEEKLKRIATVKPKPKGRRRSAQEVGDS
jgi:hypothetical protein